MPEVLDAADQLASFGVEASVVCLTSADLIFRAQQVWRGLRTGDDSILDRLFPSDAACPIVAVLDGHPHTLAFLGGINNSPITSLGVDDFGQVGEVSDLYALFGI